METLVLDIQTVGLTDDQFDQLCQHNSEWRIEQTAKGELIVMSPVGGESGKREASLIVDLGIWNRQTGLGHVFSSSTVFRLPNGGKRSPDAAWIANERWNALTPEQQRKFPAIAPDFVIELRSATDDLETLQAKMAEYLDGGVRLGWLFNPQDQRVEIYRLGATVEVLDLPIELSGEDVLPGFTLSIPIF
ncbi:MAG: Uma2 family endonuclease [Oculatellaceae cyanobacterium Prado106]|nr:Uma2 family endonuclease [Oculatellaceae cyanobacterium Prado106]